MYYSEGEGIVNAVSRGTSVAHEILSYDTWRIYQIISGIYSRELHRIFDGEINAQISLCKKNERAR
jgi:hypothetical protein